LNADVTFDAAGNYLTGATIAGPGNFTVGSKLIWNSGSFQFGGKLLIPAGSVLDTGTLANSRTLGRQLENSGTVNIGSGSTITLRCEELGDGESGYTNIAPGT